MNSRNAYLKDESLLNLFSLNNLIVPEIQREYVWGNNPDVLEKFLQQLEQIASPCTECHHVHTNKNVNVGFLYSYKPAYVKFEGERILDEYLIDGQQRITTLFLLLLYRASIEGRIDDFIVISRAEESVSDMGFNYKVRNLTQQFVLRLIQHVKESDNQRNAFDFVDNIENDAPYWFLNDYKTDPTVMAMIGALRSMRKTFGNVENCYFDFLLNNIHFWHFKTEATSQGEELYITMNSRGEQLTENEMKKARTLPAEKMMEFGSKWESWQTLFWRNRYGKNADKGFNNYLATIDGLEEFIFNKGEKENTNIEKVEKYIDALKYVTGSDFIDFVKNKSEYTYTAWFDDFQKEIWNLINTYDGTWSIPNPIKAITPQEKQTAQKEYNNKSIARNKAMLFWPWMYYYATLNEEEPDNSYLIRLIHFYYVRYNCYKRSATTIAQLVDSSKTNDFILNALANEESEQEDDEGENSKLFSEEELLVSELENHDINNRKHIESIIWEIQDLPYFKDGKDVGGNTFVDYLRKDETIIDRSNIIDSLESFKNNIKAILVDDIKETGNIIVKRILLFYKTCNGQEFWALQSPWYYSNYETSLWKRIVRNPCFRLFYKEYVNSNKNLEDFLTDKRNEFFKTIKTIRCSDNQPCHRELCIIYDAIIDGGIWDDNHANIVLNRNEDGVKIYMEQDKVFKAKRYADLKIKLPEDWSDILRENYNVEILK